MKPLLDDLGITSQLKAACLFRSKAPLHTISSTSKRKAAAATLLLVNLLGWTWRYAVIHICYAVSIAEYQFAFVCIHTYHIYSYIYILYACAYIYIYTQMLPQMLTHFSVGLSLLSLLNISALGASKNR